jgi:hypothetical protein
MNEKSGALTRQAHVGYAERPGARQTIRRKSSKTPRARSVAVIVFRSDGFFYIALGAPKLNGDAGVGWYLPRKSFIFNALTQLIRRSVLSD